MNNLQVALTSKQLCSVFRVSEYQTPKHHYSEETNIRELLFASYLFYCFSQNQKLSNR